MKTYETAIAELEAERATVTERRKVLTANRANIQDDLDKLIERELEINGALGFREGLEAAAKKARQTLEKGCLYYQYIEIPAAIRSLSTEAKGGGLIMDWQLMTV